MATHSSILAWIIPWTEETGRLQSMGCEESDTTERLTLLIHFFFNVYQYQLLLKKTDCVQNNYNNNQWWKNRQIDQLSRIESQKQTHINKGS